MSAIALPPELRKFEGRITDIDSHEMMPVQAWVDIFGKEYQPIADWLSQEFVITGKSDVNDLNSLNYPDYTGEADGIGEDILNHKGSRAPGAIDPARRLEVMNAAGVHRQLMFPGVSPKLLRIALYGASMPGSSLLEEPEFLRKADDRHALARRWMSIYDDWCVDVCAGSGGRIRPAVLVSSASPEDLYSYVESLIKRGIRAFFLPTGVPPAGKSPAHSDHDRLWSLLEEADCAVTLHVGCENDFFKTRDWVDAPVFAGYKELLEFASDPWTLATLHIPAQNFLSTMVMGGVFDRHPRLRMGVVELGAMWIGPLMEILDSWYLNSKMSRHLPRKPSDYIKSNVRVTPFFFEDAGKLIEKYDLEDVLCFSTDYPHIEGGQNMYAKYYDNVKRLGPAVEEKFFVTNGELLLPA
ncbi:MAG: amidohydrolase family protein [Sphingobium sp.]